MGCGPAPILPAGQGSEPRLRGKFVEGVRQAYVAKLHLPAALTNLNEPRQFNVFVNSLFQQDWVVCAKPAFGGPTQVLRYLGRYTHRVAISNHRLLAFDGDSVTFRCNTMRMATSSA